MGKFVVSVRKDGEFQFVLKASNGQVILVSEGYKAKASCMKGIESVKKNAASEKMFEHRVSKDNKPYFVLKAANGEIIGTSEMYSSEDARNNGIRSVMENAPTATIEDLAI